MKKCPKCGNPSYDGAPVCGNCGYEFPKTKVVAPKREDIFQKEPKAKKEDKAKKETKAKKEDKAKKESNKSNNDDTVSIIKNNKLLIGAILLITVIVICGIFLTGNANNKTNETAPLIQSSDLLEYEAGDFSFKYPDTWKKVNGSDIEHPGAIFFQNEDNVTIEFYNITSSAKSLKEITQQRISHAQGSGDYVELVETITLDGRNSSNILLENANGDYTRYVSMFSDGELYVFKMSGTSENDLTSQSIENAINSADIK